VRPFASPEVEAAFAAFPPKARAGLMHLRALIFDVAGDLEVREELRWGQPAYLAPKGSTLRLAAPKAGGFALYAHCQSTVISDYAAAFAGQDRIEGNRAVLFDDVSEIDAARLGQLIAHALRYHEA